MMMMLLVVVVVVVMTGGDCNCDDCYYGYWQKSTMTMVAVVDMVIDLPLEPPLSSVSSTSASSDYYSHGPMDWSDSFLDDPVTSAMSFRNSDEDESL
jgi:hypothetical protein